MKKVLFTKHFENRFLDISLHQTIQYETIPFLEINLIQKEKFENQIRSNFHHYLLTSQNAAKAIQNLKLHGTFYVVGNKTAQFLTEQGFKVAVVKNDAKDLADYITKHLEPTQWTYFCGNHRRNTLLDELDKSNHKIHEIIVYESVKKPQKLTTKNWDGIAFFSPLGVQSYFEYNEISEETTIFTIGKTTSEEVSIYTNNQIITASLPSLSHLVHSINEFFHDKK